MELKITKNSQVKFSKRSKLGLKIYPKWGMSITEGGIVILTPFFGVVVVGIFQ